MSSEPVLHFGPYRLSAPAGPLWREHEQIPLRTKSAHVLWTLARQQDRIVGRDELLAVVWPRAVVSDGVLAVCISEIRQALGDDRDKPRYIQTMHRRGYRFIAPVTAPVPAAVASQPPALAGEPAGALATDVALLVGREHELKHLQRCYAEACGGRRRLVFVSGEAGIGKTTLVETWLRTLEPDARRLVARGMCVEHYGVCEPYLPLLEVLQELCGGQEGPMVMAVLRRVAPTWLLQLPALLDQSEYEAPGKQALAVNAMRMLRELIDFLAVLSAERPLVLVLEDLHWSDPSTVEALSLLAQHQETARLLIVGTCRTVELIVQDHPLKTVKRELLLHGRCSELVLAYLDESAVQTYLTQRFTEQIGAALAAPIHRRTAGHALYMEMLADYLTRHEAFGEYLKNRVPAYLAVSLEALDTLLPDGLRAAIELQFERLNERERQVLEAASVAGTEFVLATVATLSSMAEEEVERICERLCRHAQFITDLGLATWPDGTISGRYAFRHALYPEVLYQRIGSGRQLRLHQLLGERLERGFGEQSGAIAADLAHHFTQSHDVIRAVRYLRQAADNAQRRYANQETTHYLYRALALLGRLPRTPERDRKELALLLRLGPALIATRGYAATDVKEVYVRAHALCVQLDDEQQLFIVLRGLWVFYCIRADYRRALEAGEQLLVLGQRMATPENHLEAYRALGGILLYCGRFSEARIRLDQGLALCGPEHHPSRANHLIHDPGVVCRYLHAYTLWFLGYSEQASMRMDAALENARRIAHPYTLVCAMGTRLDLHQHRREPRLVQVRAETMLAFANEQGFSYWAAIGAILNGWASAMLGQCQAGLAELQRGLATHRDTGAVNSRPYFLGLFAEALARAGDVDTALKVVAEALALSNRTQEGYYEAELHRLQGELLLRQGGMDVADAAEACFQQSLAIARRQQARALELRGATSLARLWHVRGKRRRAYDSLAPIHDWFTEGFDTADLQDAKALLDELVQGPGSLR